MWKVEFKEGKELTIEMRGVKKHDSRSSFLPSFCLNYPIRKSCPTGQRDVHVSRAVKGFQTLVA